jgi:RNA polymerase sigma factor (sigma-70 family)
LYAKMTAVVDTGVWQGVERERLVRLCAAISGDREAAEDLAQETLLEAWRHRHRVTDPRGADRWLAAIARNVCLRWGRTRGRLPVPFAELPEPVAPVEDRIDELLELLPADARPLLVQRYVHERSHEQIAADLGISVDAVAMRLTRSKRALRGILAADEWRPTGIACMQCGIGKLLLRRTAAHIDLACATCSSDDVLVRYPLDNPQFARLVSGLERPSAMLRRVSDWALRYFSGGDGSSAECTRCSQPVTVRAHLRKGRIHGLYVRCGSCGEEVWSSLVGLTGALPQVRGVRPRRLVEVREERNVLAVVQSSVDGSRKVETAFDRATYTLLSAA